MPKPRTRSTTDGLFRIGSAVVAGATSRSVRQIVFTAIVATDLSSRVRDVDIEARCTPPVREPPAAERPRDVVHLEYWRGDASRVGYFVPDFSGRLSQPTNELRQ